MTDTNNPPFFASLKYPPLGLRVVYTSKPKKHRQSMRLRIRLWPQTMTMASSVQATGKIGGVLRQFFSWRSVGAALLGVLLAKWTWLLFAPASPAIPAAAWEASAEAERVFGTASVTDTSAPATLGNIKLVGVFAHRTRGFAVMLVDEKQIGVGQGDEVKPGIRLVETHADHVILERAGIRQRVDLTSVAAPEPGGAGLWGAGPGITAPAVVSSAPTYAPPAAPGKPSPPSSPVAGVPQEQLEALQHKLGAADNLPPEQRDMLKRKLENLRGSH